MSPVGDREADFPKAAVGLLACSQPKGWVGDRGAVLCGKWGSRMEGPYHNP